MTNYLHAQITIPMDSALPEDACQNNLYFAGNEATRDASAEQVFALVEAFYQGLAPSIYPDEVSPTFTVKIYDTQDPAPRPPIFTDTFAVTTIGADGMPHEVAVCLSFQGVALAGQVQARRRGRIYLGPVERSLYEETDSKIFVKASLRTAIATNAATLLLDGIDAECRWCVYSPTLDALSSDTTGFTPVDNGWIDNAFDTQRRRGEAPTSRTLFGPP